MTDRDIDKSQLERPMIPLVSKSVPPALTGTEISRERIMHLLEDGSKKTFTFIIGAEGYGKTAVLSEWYQHLKQQGQLVAWFRADRADIDPLRFWLNVHYALDASFQKTGLRSLAEYQAMDHDESIWVLANDLSLLARENNGMHIIIEGFDTIDGSRSMEEFLLMATALSSDVHLYLSSRLVYTKHSFSVSIVENPNVITTKDLAYTREEFEQVLEAGLGYALEPCYVEQLFMKTLGWPYAVNEALVMLREAKNPAALLDDFTGVCDCFWEFFEFEVFARIDPALQEFLLKMSMARRISSRFCSYILNSDASDIINRLIHENLFLYPLDATREWFFIHPLFSDWLVEKAKSRPSSESRHLNGRASRWCLSHGLVNDAARHRILAAERDDLLSLIRVPFPELNAKQLALRTSVNTAVLSQEIDACFCLLAAWAYVFVADVENATRWAAEAESRAEHQQDKDLIISIRVIEAKCLCLKNDFAAGIALARQYEDQLSEEKHVPLRAFLVNCYAEDANRCGDLQQGMKWHKELEALAISCSFEYMRAINQYEIAYSYLQQGLLRRALQACHALELSLPHDYPVRGAAVALTVRIRAIQGYTENADERLAEAFMGLSRRANADMYVDWCIARTWVAIIEGLFEDAEKALHEAEEFIRYGSQTIPRNVSVLPFSLEGVLSIAQNEDEAALEAYRKLNALGVAETYPSRLVRQGVEVSAMCDNAESSHDVEELRDTLLEHGYHLWASLFDIWLALREFEEGSKSKAVRMLHQHIDFLADEQIVLPFEVLCTRIRPLLVLYLTTAKQEYKKRAFVRALLKRSSFESLAETSEDRYEIIGLTQQEERILKLAISGISRQEIAEELCVSEGTIKTHLSHLYAKFGVKKYRHLLERAAELGIS